MSEISERKTNYSQHCLCLKPISIRSLSISMLLLGRNGSKISQKSTLINTTFTNYLIIKTSVNMSYSLFGQKERLQYLNMYWYMANVPGTPSYSVDTCKDQRLYVFTFTYTSPTS